MQTWPLLGQRLRSLLIRKYSLQQLLKEVKSVFRCIWLHTYSWHVDLYQTVYNLDAVASYIYKHKNKKYKRSMQKARIFVAASLNTSGINNTPVPSCVPANSNCSHEHTRRGSFLFSFYFTYCDVYMFIRVKSSELNFIYFQWSDSLVWRTNINLAVTSR